MAIEFIYWLAGMPPLQRIGMVLFFIYAGATLTFMTFFVLLIYFGTAAEKTGRWVEHDLWEKAGNRGEIDG